MRALIIVAVAACQLTAQQGPPIAILRGELLKWDFSGRFNVSTKDHGLCQCTFDRDTYLTKNGSRITAAAINSGSLVEAVVDRRGQPGRCHALTIYVLSNGKEAPLEAYKRILDRQRHLLDHIAPRGEYAFAGIVLEADSGRLVLRTRSQGRKVLRLREDTRFTSEGKPADASMLEAGDRVFVRAGTGLDGELEAHQVIRGRILIPR